MKEITKDHESIMKDYDYAAYENNFKRKKQVGEGKPLESPF